MSKYFGKNLIGYGEPHLLYLYPDYEKEQHMQIYCPFEYRNYINMKNARVLYSKEEPEKIQKLVREYKISFRLLHFWRSNCFDTKDFYMVCK